VTHQVRSGVRGVLPLDGRLEPWMEELFSDPDGCAALVAEHGSPLNVLDFSPLARNAGELLDVAAGCGVRTRVFVARKANKALGLVDAARDAGLGIDVASLGELTQCLDAGADPDDLVVTAAVKAPDLLRTCVERGVPASLDNADEAADLVALARVAGVTARVGLRIGIDDDAVAPTRFGLLPRRWLEVLAALGDALDALDVEGVHFHLNGYSAAERAVALQHACDFVDVLRAAGHRVRWIDMGGGVPMSYLTDEEQWRTFWRGVDVATADELTWRGGRLGLVDPESARPSPALYPYWQEEVRGAWLSRVLETSVGAGGAGTTVADLLRERDLELRLEPGRSMLDGCGVTLAAVAFRKESSDGVPLVGLHMNRTQVRSTSADFLVDPVWLRPDAAGEPDAPRSAFLVGAYCVEEELLLRRRLEFPEGVARGDLAAFVNTGGYLMHILESASHQLPLARTLTRVDGRWEQDRIDAL
jgi:diaminopimelate decarboxylase